VDPRILQTNDRPEIRTDDEAWQPLVRVGVTTRIGMLEKLQAPL